MNAESPPRTLTPNQQARRVRIQAAARELVSTLGYDGMIMRDVASMAKVSPTTLYNLYNTKDELLLESLRESVAEDWDNARAAEPALGLQRLVAQMRTSAQHTRDNPAYARAISKALFRANEQDELIRVLVLGSRDGVLASLRFMQKKKQLVKKLSLEKTANAMVAAFWANYFMWGNHIIATEDLETELLRAYLSFLLPVTVGKTQQTVSKLLRELNDDE